MKKMESLEMRIPTRIKQFPNFLCALIDRHTTINKKQNVKSSTFHLCFFSCESYFAYLYCACHSLIKVLDNSHNYKVYVFSDSDMPITAEQVGALEKLVPNIHVVSWPKSMGWGHEQIKNIWDAYQYVAEKASNEDIIARVDSDVFFFNNRIFNYVSASEADLIGDGHFVNFDYVQGGCYFFKKRAVEKIYRHINDRGIETALVGCHTVVEDVAADFLAKKLALTVKQTWFMGFPDELNNMGGIKQKAQLKFSCAHFVMKNKDKMLEAYARDVVTVNEYQSMMNVISTVTSIDPKC